jgi:lipid II:glycine glycyltransferase (peptidoglycan interpeptide bridge formation enzyme)
MFNMKLIQCHSKQEWNEYVLENGGHPLQLWGWGDVKSVHGWQALRMFMYNDTEELVGAAQVLIRHLPWPMRSLAYVPRGPVVDESNRAELLNSLADYIRRTYHSVALTIEPDSTEYTVPKGWKHSKNKILPALTLILDLNKTDAELLNDMAKKTRQYIRKSASEAITIEKVKSREDLDKCLDIYQATANRAKFNIHDRQYYYDVFSKLASHSQLFAAYYEGEPISFLWLAISADTAFELYGGMNEKGQELRTNYALKWYAIRKCKEWGLTRYDFGGLLDGGVTTFKKGWAEGDTLLAGTFDKKLSMFYGLYTTVLPTAKAVTHKLKRILKH